MNRAELHQLAQDRLDDAKVLLDHGRWSAAYYLAGYSVECGLKACVLKYVENTGVIFKDKKFAEKCWTHNLETLVSQADLELALHSALQSNPNFASSWALVKDWTESSRYDQKSEAEAKNLYAAITNSDGIFPWLQTHW